MSAEGERRFALARERFADPAYIKQVIADCAVMPKPKLIPKGHRYVYSWKDPRAKRYGGKRS